MRNTRYAAFVTVLMFAGTSLVHAQGVSLEWGTYFGGSDEDRHGDVCFGGSGSIVVTGETYSSSLAYNCTYSDRSGNGDGFWAVFNSGGERQSTCHITGIGHTEGVSGVVFDGESNMYLCGSTESDDGIATDGAHQTTYNLGRNAMYASFPRSDAYFVKVNAQGSIEWGTYYGGRNADVATGVAVGPDGSIYFAGETSSFTHIATSGAHQEALDPDSDDSESRNVWSDGFLTKFTQAGVQVWGTYLGGPLVDRIRDVATDSRGAIYVTGTAMSREGIASSGAFQTTRSGSGLYDTDAFLVKFSADGQRVWGTYFGGAERETGYGVAVDDQDNVYICGSTLSSDVAPSVMTNEASGGGDCFVAKFSSEGTCAWARYFGGAENDDGHAIACGGGKVYVAGGTKSTAGIASEGFDMALSAALGTGDVFVAAFASDDGTQVWGTYYGGAGHETGEALAVGNDGVLCVTGKTTSDDGIAAQDAFLGTRQGDGDVFLACLKDETPVASVGGKMPATGAKAGPRVAMPDNRTLALEGVSGNLPLHVMLHDARGRTVLHTRLAPRGSAGATTLSLPALANGIYMVSLRKGNETLRFRCALR